MQQHLIFHIVFLSQILVISYFVPSRIYGRMKYIFDTYPPSAYPKLYPRPVEYYESGRRSYRNLNVAILVLGLLILAALFVNPHDNDLGVAISLGFYFVQFIPLMILEFSSFKELKLMRNAGPRPTRKAELRPRHLFDFISPVLFGLAVLVYVVFVGIILYMRQFEYEWFGGFINITGLTLMNLLFAGIVLWNMYGKKQNPHQSYEDRKKQIEAILKSFVFISIAATVFVMLSVVLSALEIRHLMPIAMSLYLQIVALACIPSYVIDYRNFDVYREDPIVT
jgi:hypothetical protein